VVFFATPNGIAMQQAASLLEAGVKVVDLAADFRIKDIALWEKWYGMQHASPALVAEAVYGLPESESRADPQGPPGGQSRLLPDGDAARFPAAGRGRLRRYRPPDRRRQVGRLRCRSQGRNRHPVFRGVG
jgi:hypothetical protein